jgi:hypothetical protein
MDWFGDKLKSAYDYVSGIQISQGIAGANRRAGQTTNRAHQNWLANAQARGRAAATMERVVEEELDEMGIPSGKAHFKSTRSGNYLKIPYMSSTGVERNAHFSGHPVENPAMRPSAIGAFHAKVETGGRPTYQARAVPTFNRTGLPSFGDNYVGVKKDDRGVPPAPPVTSHAPGVFEALGRGYTAGLHQHMASKKQPYRGRGGKKTMKRRKTSRKQRRGSK